MSNHHLHNVAGLAVAFAEMIEFGEAYMKQGENELAIENYQKSLELNPNNVNGKEMLKKLGVKK